MKRDNKNREEQRVSEILQGIFNESLKDVEFCYWKNWKGIIVTYEDFKTEIELKEQVQQAVGDDWKVLLKRVYSDLSIMVAMLEVYEKNEISVIQGGADDVRVEKIRAYVNSILEKK